MASLLHFAAISVLKRYNYQWILVSVRRRFCYQFGAVKWSEEKAKVEDVAEERETVPKSGLFQTDLSLYVLEFDAPDQTVIEINDCNCTDLSSFLFFYNLFISHFQKS